MGADLRHGQGIVGGGWCRRHGRMGEVGTETHRCGCGQHLSFASRVRWVCAMLATSSQIVASLIHDVWAVAQ